MYKIIFKPFYALMNRYVSSRKQWNFCDIKLGHELSEEELNSINEFRIACYLEDAPYLVPTNEEEALKEKFFDLNSYHVLAKDLDGKIVGSLRLLKRPFEIEHLSIAENAKEGLDDYLEISRLVCSVRKKGLGRRLLIRAGVWSIQQTSFKGFTAICKCHRLPMFRRFGLKPKTSFTISERGDQTYHLIKADFSQISLVTMRAFVALQLNRLAKMIDLNIKPTKPAL